MPTTTRPRLELDPAVVRRARSLARTAGRPVVRLAQRHTTVSVERATLRLAGLSGADHERVPWVNHLVDAVRGQVGLEHGVTTPVWDALRRAEAEDLLTLAQKAASGSVSFRLPEGTELARARRAARTAVAGGLRTIDRQRTARERLVRRLGDPPQRPWIYVIVATGNIYDDVAQAQAAAQAGADIIAVIRSTAQSLLDYVPDGATTEGYGGTYATQENFRIMRAALDEASARARPLRPADQLLVGPVHDGDRLDGGGRAARHAAQRRDVRDPLPRHQHAARSSISTSRAASSRAPASSSTPARTTTSPPPTPSRRRTPCSPSQFINEASPSAPASRGRQMGLGHAYEIDPELPEDASCSSSRRRSWSGSSSRTHPLKWMPPTKHKTGDIFHSHVLRRDVQPGRRHDGARRSSCSA